MTPVDTDPQIPQCPLCIANKAVSRDHRVPDWLINKLHFFGISFFDLIRRAGITKKEIIWLVCPQCNHDKGGFYDFSDEIARKFMKVFIEMLEERMDAKKSIKVKCECHEVTEAMMYPRMPGESEMKYQHRIDKMAGGK